jgi:hypothetical protein
MSFLLLNCKSDSETKKVEFFLQTFNRNIANYKVICFVPVNGCGSCIENTLIFAKRTGSDFLLVLSSLFQKSIDNAVENDQLNQIEYISDSKSLATKSGLVSEIAPCFYFLKDGKVVKKFDLSTTYDKVSILKDVEKYLAE